MLKPDDVVVVQTAVDLDLGHELLLGARLGQRGLGDDLGGGNSLSLEVGKLIALRKAALAEELAAQVLLDADVSVELDDLLLDDDLRIVLLVLLGLACLSLLLHRL